MQLSLNLLGPFHATLAGQPIPESRTKKIEALLIYLVMEAAHVHRREALVGLLFPDQPEEMARTNLRQTLNRLRKSIQDKDATPPFLLITRESTQFNQAGNYHLDVALFRQALQGCDDHVGRRNGHCPNCMARLQKGIEHVRGPFLDGFFLEDSSAFQEWVLTYREQFQQEMLAALQQLTHYFEQRGVYEMAAVYARRWTAVEPWDEAAQRQLMRLMAYQGQRNAALMQYVTLQKMLLDELGVEPTAETTALRDMIAAAGDKRPFHLPPREQAIVGRDDELAAIHEQLADPDRRLCTLVGPGGIGKTRLALETGWRVAANYMGPFLHGVYFVPLAGVAAATQQPAAGVITQLVTAVAESLDFTFSGPRPPEQQLMQYLHHKSLLLILDNCEHLIDAVRDLAQAVFAQTDQVKLLVTSRERLHMGVEWMLAIDGLPYPPPTPADLDLEQYSAVQLFMQRAQQVDADFVPNGENGRCGLMDIGRICRTVRGIPLAIELAVPWVRLLTCREIAQEIEQNLDALTTSMAHVPARHRSMRAVFEHSWSLLADSERQMVVRLSVFRGGFDRQAAESVAGASLMQLAALLDKSLVHRLDDNAVVRYQMQEVLRQYAAEKLADSAAETAISALLSTGVFHQHSRYYLDFVTRRSADLRGQRQPEALDEIRHEIENIRAAWQYALDHDLFDLINEATDTLALFYYMRSWAAEGVTLFAQAAERLAAVQPTQPITLGKLRARQGWFAFLKGEHIAAQSLLQQSLDHLRTADATDEIVYPLSFLAVVTYTLGDYEAAYQLATEGLRLSEQLDDPYRIAIANNILSQVAYLQGDYDAAAQFCETSLTIERRIGNRWSMGFSLTNLGRVAYAQGDYDTAQTYYQESLSIREAMRDARGQAICLNYLGDTVRAMGSSEAAIAHYQASLKIAKEIGDLASLAISLTRLGFVYREEQNEEQAWHCFRDALQQAPAMPQRLNALVGMAALIRAADPVLAANLVGKIRRHPVATAETKEIAAELQAALPQSEGDSSLEQLIDVILEKRPEFNAA